MVLHNSSQIAVIIPLLMGICIVSLLALHFYMKENSRCKNDMIKKPGESLIDYGKRAEKYGVRRINVKH